MIHTDIHPTFVTPDVVHAVRNGLAKLSVREVMRVCFERLSLGTILNTLIAEMTEAIFLTSPLLFRVHRDDRLARMKESFDAIADV